MSLNAYELGLFYLAIYMVAFIVDKDAKFFLVACITSEVVGRLSLLQWAMTYSYGAYMHMMWAIIYSYALAYYGLKCNLRKVTAGFVFLYVTFQLSMSADCFWSSGNVTFLYIHYKIIVTVLHCCIVSSFIKWRGVVRFVDDFFAGVWRFFNLHDSLFYIMYTLKKEILK